MLEGSETGDRVEGAEALAREAPAVEQVHVETVTPAGGHLRRRQGDADTVAPSAPNRVEQRAPTTAEVEHTTARSEADLLGDELVLPILCLFQGHRKVAVVLRAAEVGQLSQAEAEHAVDQ